MFDAVFFTDDISILENLCISVSVNAAEFVRCYADVSGATTTMRVRGEGERGRRTIWDRRREIRSEASGQARAVATCSSTIFSSMYNNYKILP